MKLTHGLIGVTLLFAACSSEAPSASPPGEATSTAVSNDFHPTDAGLLGTTGRPQLVEFFAYW